MDTNTMYVKKKNCRHKSFNGIYLMRVNETVELTEIWFHLRPKNNMGKVGSIRQMGVICLHPGTSFTASTFYVKKNRTYARVETFLITSENREVRYAVLLRQDVRVDQYMSKFKKSKIVQKLDKLIWGYRLLSHCLE